MNIFKKIQYNSPVILTFAIISFCVLLLGYATSGKSNILLFSVSRGSFANPLTYIRLFTHVLGHQDFNHYFNNMVLFLLIGPSLEEKYGSKDIFILILITALITGLVSMLLTDTYLLGASGVVFMLILLSSFANFEKGKIPLTLILIIIIFVGQEIVTGMGVSDNISQLAHIVGGLCGAVLGYYLNVYKSKKTL